MLEVRDLDARYGDIQALFGVGLDVPRGAGVALLGRNGVGLDVPRGAGVALLGRNGAGKSTLMKALLDAGPASSGQVLFGGKPLAGLGTEARARLGLALVPEDRRIFTNLTVRQNLELAQHALTGGRSGPSLDEMGRLFPALPPLFGRLGYQLSGGQQQLVAVVRGLMAGPAMLLLDEPSEGLAPKLAMELADEVRRAREQLGVAVLLAEQNVAYARRCTEYVYLLDSGSIVFRGGWDEFDAQPELRTRYLAV